MRLGVALHGGNRRVNALPVLLDDLVDLAADSALQLTSSFWSQTITNWDQHLG